MDGLFRTQCIYICTYVGMYVYIHTHIHTYHTYMHACMHTYIHIYMHTSIHRSKTYTQEKELIAVLEANVGRGVLQVPRALCACVRARNEGACAAACAGYMCVI